MDAAGRGIPTPPPTPLHHRRPHVHLRSIVASAPRHSSVTLHGQPSPLGSSTTSSSLVRHLPASILSAEERPSKPDGRLTKTYSEFKEHLQCPQRRLLQQPGFWYLMPTYMEEELLSGKQLEYLVTETNTGTGLVQKPGRNDSTRSFAPLEGLDLAKKAMLATQEAATFAEKSHLSGDDFDESNLSRSAKQKPIIRSGRLLRRQLKKRRVPKKQEAVLHEVHPSSMITEASRKINKGLNSNDPLRLFLGVPQARQLLTVKEEKDLFIKIEDLMRVEEVKNRLHMQFAREPTLVEWAEAVRMSCRVLQSCLVSGSRSREKMLHANFRLVVHVSKQYQGKGLDLQDLLQVGGMGLVKSLKKFKPKAGSRFPTYAYWWIRQSIKKAIFQNSRTIRLPENVFATLKKIKSARRLHIQEEGHYPNNEDLAKRVGVTVEKLERILNTSRIPVSLQDCVWAEQDVTLQEITADPKVETPDLYTEKQMMRQHARNLVTTLPPRERQIIRSRHGLDGGEQKTLSDIGGVYGISKQRIRQLESRALDKLRDCLDSQGLEAYANLLV